MPLEGGSGRGPRGPERRGPTSVNGAPRAAPPRVDRPSVPDAERCRSGTKISGVRVRCELYAGHDGDHRGKLTGVPSLGSDGRSVRVFTLPVQWRDTPGAAGGTSPRRTGGD